MTAYYKTNFLVWSLFLSANIASAQPINYQGRLSDKSGVNVDGTKNFALRIFDAKTGGKQIYEENIGAVAVNEGAYSFNFGENGKSVSTATETIATADGAKQIFNYIVKNKPVTGGIKISGGGYSWTESGSSDAAKFTATANKNSGAVSAIFLTGAPAAGENVSISYDHNSNGVMGALSHGGQAWLEIAVGGETLSPRERLVSVPFALYANTAKASTSETLLLNQGGMWSSDSESNLASSLGVFGLGHITLPNDKNKIFSLGEFKISMPKKATYLKVSFAHIVAGNSHGGSDQKRNINAKIILLLDDKIIESRPLNTSWSQQVGRGKSALYADYPNMKIPVSGYSEMPTFKIEYQYISGGFMGGSSGLQGSGSWRTHHSFNLGGIMYLIILAGFS